MQVIYSSIDGTRIARTFKTVAGARRFAHLYVGATPEIGSTYAVSGDGVGKVEVKGLAWREVFPACFPAEQEAMSQFDSDDALARIYAADQEAARAAWEEEVWQKECDEALDNLY